MATYSIEHAKSGRSTCKKCGEKINNDDLRVGIHRVNADDITMTSWNHARCFKLPKGANIDEFFVDLAGYRDLTDENQRQVMQDIERNSEAKKTTAKRKSGEGADASSPKKKRLSIDNFPEEEQPYFTKYNAMTVDELKDYMRWNNQPVTGTKGELVKRCIDGEMHGAFPSCPEPGCSGKLRLEGDMVTCSGAFSESVGAFVRCYFKAKASSVSRVPWRTAAKSESEMVSERSFVPTVDTSIAANLYDGIDLSTVPGKKEALGKLLEIAVLCGLNVPEDPQEAKVKLGTLMMNHSNLSPPEHLALAEEMLGTKQQKQEMARTSTMGTACEANAG